MRKLLLGLSVVSALFFTACEDDTSDIVLNITNNNGNSDGGGSTTTTETEIGGTQAASLTLDGPGNNVEYILTSPLIMEDGTTLTITAGTKIKSSAGTNGYIAIKQGAKINANGTQCNPIVMTSNASSPAAGDWGGVVILGKAPINAGDSATSEVGEFTYGGSDASDNSGVLNYVRLEYTGAAINTESEFNGFSFYGVGNGTVVSNIEAYEGADDGAEFFGGTVNVDNIIITNAQDDSLDWTEGWSGTVNNVYIDQNTEGDHAIEADGNEDNNAAEPFSNPTINNITMIGAGSGNGQEAVRLRRGTKVTMTNVWVQGYDEGFDIDDAQTASNNASGELNVNDVTFVDVNTRLKTDDNTSSVTEATFFNGIGNGTLTDVNTWGYCWSTVSGGANAATIDLSGTYTTNLTLNAANNYRLVSALIMEEGTTLTIPAGTQIKAVAGGTQVYIGIKQGAKIMAEGTAAQPIVITSNASSPSAGDWGGLVVAGKAQINAGDTATSEVGNFTYGGSDDADNSGVIKYMRLEYTGAAINTESEFNGFSFYAVGSGTVVENIQAHKGADDGIEFFGGTVNVTNLVVTDAQDDSVDWTEGFRGTLENVYIKQDDEGDKAIEADGNEDNNSAQPYSSPTINNITAIGVGGGEAFRLRRGTQVNMNNVYIQNYDEAYDVNDPLTVDWIQQDVSNVSSVTFDAIATNLNSEGGSNGAEATEAEFFSGVGNGTILDVSGWAWATGL